LSDLHEADPAMQATIGRCFDLTDEPADAGESHENQE